MRVHWRRWLERALLAAVFGVVAPAALAGDIVDFACKRMGVAAAVGQRAARAATAAAGSAIVLTTLWAFSDVLTASTEVLAAPSFAGTPVQVHIVIDYSFCSIAYAVMEAVRCVAICFALALHRAAGMASLLATRVGREHLLLLLCGAGSYWLTGD